MSNNRSLVVLVVLVAVVMLVFALAIGLARHPRPDAQPSSSGGWETLFGLFSFGRTLRASDIPPGSSSGSCPMDGATLQLPTGATCDFAVPSGVNQVKWDEQTGTSLASLTYSGPTISSNPWLHVISGHQTTVLPGNSFSVKVAHSGGTFGITCSGRPPCALVFPSSGG